MFKKITFLNDKTKKLHENYIKKEIKSEDKAVRIDNTKSKWKENVKPFQ